MAGSIASVARRQLGLVTRSQALTVLKPHHLSYRLRAGELELVRKGVYRVVGVAASWEQSVLGACLAVLRACLAVPDAAASFRCAAALWGFEDFVRDEIEITVSARDRRRLEGVTVHDSSVVGPLHPAHVGVVPVTSPARTLCDLTALEPARRVEHTVDEALRRKLVTLKALGRVADQLAGRGRHRCTVMREILEHRIPGYHPGDSDPERRIAELLVRAGLPEPTRQHHILIGSRKARIDLCYPEARIAIEYDGWDFYRGRKAFDDDRAHANELVMLGFSVLRFTSRSGDHRHRRRRTDPSMCRLSSAYRARSTHVQARAGRGPT